MRNTRQVPTGQDGGMAPTLQQLMESLRALQEANEQSRQEQERLREANERSVLEQERLREELRKTHEELRRDLQQRDRRPPREREASLHERDSAELFSRAIMDEVEPMHYVAPRSRSWG